MPKKATIAPTTISHFHSCPLAFQFIKILKVPQIEIVEPRRPIGTNMHLIIKMYYTHMTSPKPTPEQIRTTANNCFKNYFDESLAEYKKEMQLMLNNFIMFEIARIPNYHPAIEVEKWDEDDIYGGYIDMFDGFTIYDWKINIQKLYDEHLVQGKAYQRIKRNKGYGEVNVCFFGLENGKSLYMPRMADEWLENLRVEMLNMIAAGNFPAKPSPLCGWCPVQLACTYKFKNLWEGQLDCLII